MAVAKELVYQTIRTVAFGGITGVFADLGASFSAPARLFKIVNSTNQTAEITTDATNVQDTLPANSFALYDLTTNRVNDEGAFMRTGTQFQVRRPAAEANPTSGSVSLVVLVGA